jgi:crossover junction endodeoxyribonuclease RusA
MTVLIRPPKYSFPVIGRPVSAQSSNHSKCQYKELVKAAAQSSVNKTIEIPQKIKMEIDWFAKGSQDRPDVDNIIKPIQDALKGIVFGDDCQVESITSRMHDANSVMHFSREPLFIVEPLKKGNEEYIFIRIY